jgi:hypothetical protein
MSWKNVQDHYRIGHQVQIRDGRICIGSAYISDLIRVTFDGVVTWGNLGPSNNAALARYHAEMTADPAKLRELIAAPDVFAASIPVYTYDGGTIIEKHCEDLGWPNCTHDGLMMYENTFSTDKAWVVARAKRNAECGIEAWRDNLAQAEKRVATCLAQLAEDEANLAKLETDFPSRA